MRVLNRWYNQCVEWCYRRYEDGKLGDQKYLDDWASTYPNVHVLKNIGGGIGPWNVGRYTFQKENNRIMMREHETNIEASVIFYHFHSMKYFDKDVIKLANTVYYLPGTNISLLYKEYVRAIYRVIEKYSLNEKLKQWTGILDHFKSEDVDHLKHEHNYYNVSLFL